MGSLPGHFPSSDSLPGRTATSRSQTSRTESPSVQDMSRGERSTRSGASAASVESFHTRQESYSRRPSVSGTSTERLRTNGAHTPLSSIDAPPLPESRSPERKMSASTKSSSPVPQSRPDQIPERRRPPLLEPHWSQSEQAAASPSVYMTPADGPSPRDPNEKTHRNALDELIMSEERSPSGYFMNGNGTGSGETDAMPNGQLSRKGSNAPVPEVPAISGLMTSPTLTDPPSMPVTPQEEVHRPGLGPMIKKKSTKEIATAFRRAAMAHNAFKPRAGGAGERLKVEAQQGPNSPDGINGVFPCICSNERTIEAFTELRLCGKVRQLPYTTKLRLSGSQCHLDSFTRSRAHAVAFSGGWHHRRCAKSL